MKLSCLQENLNKGLNIVGRAVATRSTLPITSNVLLATDEGRLKLIATNLEMAVSCWIGAKIEEEGSITVPARLLTEFVSSLPNDTIDFTLDPKTKSLSLKCARFEARISGVDAKEFPPIPSVDEGLLVLIGQLCPNAVNLHPDRGFSDRGVGVIRKGRIHEEYPQPQEQQEEQREVAQHRLRL